MKKFINDPQNVTDELLEGFAAANKDLVTLKERRLTVSNALASSRPRDCRGNGRLRP
jgi:dihydroxyacetone kinase-like protein